MRELSVGGLVGIGVMPGGLVGSVVGEPSLSLDFLVSLLCFLDAFVASDSLGDFDDLDDREVPLERLLDPFPLLPLPLLPLPLLPLPLPLPLPLLLSSTSQEQSDSPSAPTPPDNILVRRPSQIQPPPCVSVMLLRRNILSESLFL